MYGQPAHSWDAVGEVTEYSLLMGQLHSELERAIRLLRTAIQEEGVNSGKVQYCLKRLTRVSGILADVTDTLEPDVPDQPRPAGAAPGSQLKLC